MIRQDMRIGRPTGKSAKVRILRTNASKHKGRVAQYSKIADWIEAGIGTAHPEFRVELKNGWSFSEERRVEIQTFGNVHDAMAAVNMAVRCSR